MRNGMREPRRGGTRCGRWMGIAAALLIAGLLQGGSLRGADPYRIDGWERYFAPLLDQWLILGPLPSQESVDALTSPEGLKDLFPEEGALTGGLTWRKADSAGEGVPLGAGVGGKGGRTVALTFLNHETGGEVLLHFSKRGIGRTRVLIEGVPIVSLGEEEERKEAVPFHVRRGWSRLQLALEVKAAGARFYCLITDEVGEAVGLYNQAQLFKRQRESFDTGFPLRGRVWQRVQGRAVGALNGPFSAYGRELAILRMGLRGEGKHAAEAQARIDRIRDLAGFIVRGCAATESERIHAGAVEGIKAWKALPGDDGARRDRILEDLDLLKAWLKPMISSSVSWHLLVDVTPGDHGQLWRRYGVARRLLIDLLEEARSLPGRVRSSR